MLSYKETKETRKTERLKQEKVKKRKETSNKKLFKLDFDRFPQSIYSQSNIKVISNLKFKRPRIEKVPIKRKLT